MARQQPATGGAVRYGRRPLQWAARAFAREVAYLPQQPPTAAGLKVRELVALGRYPLARRAWTVWRGRRGGGRRGDDADRRRKLRRPNGGRAVGRRQQVWLAMLVAQQARWLLLDEPTSALDIAHQIEVLALVRRLSQTRGLGVVVVLHDVNMAARFCDDLAALRAGRLIARGVPSRIVAKDELWTIFGVAMEVIAHPVTGAPVAFAS